MPQGPRTSATYEPANVEVAYSTLLEVAAALQAFRESMVLIGGWVPFLLLREHQRPDNPFKHVGSMDSDWVIDPERVDAREYGTIVRSLKRRGFTEDPELRYRLVRRVSAAGAPEVEVAVDLLTSPPPRGKGAARRHRTVQRDLAARVLEGAPLAFVHSTTMNLAGKLPSGGRLEVPIRTADVVGSIGTKGLALGRRYSEKDAYDLYALIANYGGGPVEVASLVKPFLREGLLVRGLDKVREWFGSPDAAGPAAVADFFVEEAGAARERRIRDAFEVVDRLLHELDIASRRRWGHEAFPRSRDVLFADEK